MMEKTCLRQPICRWEDGFYDNRMQNAWQELAMWQWYSRFGCHTLLSCGPPCKHNGTHCYWGQSPTCRAWRHATIICRVTTWLLQALKNHGNHTFQTQTAILLYSEISIFILSFIIRVSSGPLFVEQRINGWLELWCMSVVLHCTALPWSSYSYKKHFVNVLFIHMYSKPSLIQSNCGGKERSSRLSNNLE